jgi:hypothetical protein
LIESLDAVPSIDNFFFIWPFTKSVNIRKEKTAVRKK